jgi:cysteinyl-tRNA synthetase
MIKLGYKVTFVRNVTDIDDKIIAKAAAAGQQWWERAYIYEREFTHAYDALGVLPPTYEPRATGHVLDMIDLIQRIIDNGHAYVVDDKHGKPSGNVYFDVSSWPEYGALTHQESGTQAADDNAAVADQMGPSIDADGADKYNPVDAADSSELKRDPRDFALWKAPKESDPQTARWQTPFGVGRPGWHIECSAMSHRYLGDSFDIHGGGLDLRFPHHENEMAQSHAAGWGFAQHWMHSAWVTQKGEKMSKSLGNGLAVSAVLDAHPAWVVRYALACVQYRSMLEWSDQTLNEATSAFERISNFVERAGAALGTQPERSAIASLDADGLPADFVKAMNEDINVAGALAAIFASIRNGNTLLSQLDDKVDDDSHLDTLRQSLIQVRAMLDVFGLDPLSAQWSGSTTAGAQESDQSVLDTLIREQLDARAQARVERDFTKADAIRDALSKAGVIIEDTPSGSSWSLKH